MGETSDSRGNLGLDGSAKKAIGAVNLGGIFKQRLRFEIRAENGRFFPFGKPAEGMSTLTTTDWKKGKV